MARNKTAIPKLVKNLVLKRDGDKCQIGYMGCTGYASGCDHRAGRGAGGSMVLNAPSNLIAACWSCNWQKETLHGEERELMVSRGVIVTKAATNAATAVRARETPFTDPFGAVWLLDDEGGRKKL